MVGVSSQLTQDIRPHIQSRLQQTWFLPLEVVIKMILMWRLVKSSIRSPPTLLLLVSYIFTTYYGLL